MNAAQFRKVIWRHYRAQGRHDLPWRKTHNPYKILVSEVMLQQTQVERVKPYYEAWMKKFPTVKALASASLASVLRAWQGLGYNRRAKNLHEAAKILAKNGFPKTASELEKLPGIGPYTARAIIAFAHNADTVFIETNIRTAIMHHFLPLKRKYGKEDSTIYGTVSDREILRILEKLHPKGNAREWYAALMDYGASLKKSGIHLNAKAKGYAKQSKFAGSQREARGAILRELSKGLATKKHLLGLLGDDRKEQLDTQLIALVREGLVGKVGARYRLPS